MNAYLRQARWISTIMLGAVLQQLIAAEPPPSEMADFIARRAERFAQRPAPQDPFQRLHALYFTWKTQETLQIPTPPWASEVPEAERNALKAALEKPPTRDLDIAKELLSQARVLKSDAQTRVSAERLFVLAALEGAHDLNALAEISRSPSDPALQAEARKLVILAGTGKPYSNLSQLGIPLPDLTPYKGNPVAIVFWATWNPTFQVNWPQMKESIEKLKSSGFKVVGINFDDEKDLAASFIKDEEIEWPSIYPKGHPLRFSWDYGVKGLPAVWIVDEQRNLVSTQVDCHLEVRRTFISN